jgi:hypothetical protein
VVSAVPNNPAASGASLIAALANIQDASASKPYLVQIEPGIYEVGATNIDGDGLMLKDFVDVAGSGQDATIIRGKVNCASAELRQLSIENAHGVGLTCKPGPGETLRRGVAVRQVTIKITADSADAYGVSLAGVQGTFDSLSVIGKSQGTMFLTGLSLVGAWDSDITMTNLRVSLDCEQNAACRGLSLGGGRFDVRDSVIAVHGSELAPSDASFVHLDGILIQGPTQQTVSNTAVTVSGWDSVGIDGWNNDGNAHSVLIERSRIEADNGILYSSFDGAAKYEIAGSEIVGGVAVEAKKPATLTLLCTGNYDGSLQPVSCPVL